MPFTEYKFDSEKIRARVQEAAANCKKNTGTDDFEGFVVRLFRQRLHENPLSYREYGAYWYAVKKVLEKHEIRYGDYSDPTIADEYRGDSDIETLIMADEFRNMYLETFFEGTNQFMLDGESGKMWTLADSDMERLGKQSAGMEFV